MMATIRKCLYSPTQHTIFNYRTSRLMVGLIAFTLPFVVVILAGGFDKINSISGSYYTDARDTFVGMLFVVGSFLLAYNGHYLIEAIIAKSAGLSALLVAVFPTACDEKVIAALRDQCAIGIEPHVHIYAAIVLFVLLAYFCLGPFRKGAKKKEKKYIEAKRRKIVYIICGCVILITLAIAFVINQLDLPGFENTLYIAEFIALLMFGIAWTVAGKYSRLSFFISKDELTEDDRR